MSKLPFMPLYVSDYNSATDWLTLAQDGLYLRTLRLMWSTPNCSLPDDKVWLIRRLRITDKEYNEDFILIKEEFFSVKKGRVLQKRLQEEYGNAKTLITTRSVAGKTGAKAKALKNKEKDTNNRDVLLKQNGSKALASTLTSTVTVTSKKEPPKPPKGRKRKCSYPNDFIPSKELAEKYWLSKNRTDINYDDEADGFKTYCLAHGKTYLDWEAAWKTRYVNAVKFNRQTIGDKSSVDIFDKVMNNGQT